MGVRMEVDTHAVAATARDWADVDEDLAVARRSLTLTGAEGLSPDVAAAVETFRVTWSDEIAALARQARDHQGEVVRFGQDIHQVDTDRAALLGSLLRWIAPAGG